MGAAVCYNPPSIVPALEHSPAGLSLELPTVNKLPPYPIIAREGWPILTGLAVVALLFYWVIDWDFLGHVFLLLFLFSFQFFRDPVRELPLDERAVVSPVDGRVCKVERATVRYTPGTFVNADLDKASTENERNAVTVRMDDGRRITFVQVAGLVARRILCYTQEGDRLERGQRYGFIRFGSRVDVYLPTDAEVKVTIGDDALRRFRHKKKGSLSSTGANLFFFWGAGRDSKRDGRGRGSLEIRFDTVGQGQVGGKKLHRLEARKFHAYGPVFLVDGDERKAGGTGRKTERTQKAAASDGRFLEEHRRGDETLLPHGRKDAREDERGNLFGRLVAFFENHRETLDSALERHGVAVKRLTLRGEGPREGRKESLRFVFSRDRHGGGAFPPGVGEGSARAVDHDRIARIFGEALKLRLNRAQRRAHAPFGEFAADRLRRLRRTGERKEKLEGKGVVGHDAKNGANSVRTRRFVTVK